MVVDGTHRIYPHPPVALVVLAIDFPPLGADADADAALARLRDVLRPELPLVHEEQQFVVQMGPATHQQQVRLVPRLQTRDRTMSVAIAPEGVVIETTRYLGFEWYLDLVRGPIAAVAEHLAPGAILGIGHRYIDEVRVPDVDGTLGWSRWFAPELLAAAQLPAAAELPTPHGWQAMVNFRTSPEATLTLRYGPMEGLAVPTDGTNRREGPVPAGPYFLLDWDSRWQPAVAPEFTLDEVLDRCADLYTPVRRLFHHLTTDELRAVFERSVGEMR